jgi:catechol 2,3-dioxygenase-like lactoylglutathione lyase family enzyme
LTDRTSGVMVVAEERPMDDYASVRYVVDDVQAAIDFYTEHLGFTVLSHPAPPFADVVRGHLRVLLSGPPSSGARATPPDASGPGRNRIHLVVDDLDDHLERFRAAGITLRSEVVEGPGGRQFLVADPSGNLVEIFEAAARD